MTAQDHAKALRDFIRANSKSEGALDALDALHALEGVATTEAEKIRREGAFAEALFKAQQAARAILNRVLDTAFQPERDLGNAALDIADFRDMRAALLAAREEIARLTRERDDYALALDHFSTDAESYVVDLLDKRRNALLDIREIAAKSSAGPCPSIVRIVNAALAPKEETDE